MFIVWWKGRGNETAATILFAAVVGFVLSLILSLNLGLPLPILGSQLSWIGLGLIVAAVLNHRIAKSDTQGSSLLSIPLGVWTWILAVVGLVLFVGPFNFRFM
jgi:hypothetical protein